MAEDAGRRQHRLRRREHDDVILRRDVTPQRKDGDVVLRQLRRRHGDVDRLLVGSVEADEREVEREEKGSGQKGNSQERERRVEDRRDDEDGAGVLRRA